MKKILLIFMAALLLLSATACGGGQNGGQDDNSQASSQPPIGGGTHSAPIIFDFSAGWPEEQLRTETHYSDEQITDEELIDALSDMSGLDFSVTISEVDGRWVADWAADSTLVAGLDDREQKDDFFFYEADSLRWFMMDSLWRTLDQRELYFTMDGGKELVLGGLYPIDTFPSDLPYMGSVFYFAHADVIGDFSYVDEEYDLVLSYPSSFAMSGEPDETSSILLFPSEEDSSVLQYWVISNLYDESPEEFADHAAPEEVSIQDNVVMGWGIDLDQLTGEETPNAYYWLVEPDWIACVAISCETQEEAIEWYLRLRDDQAVSITHFVLGGAETTVASEEEAMDILVDALDMAEGTAVVFDGEEMVDGVHCWTFAYGMNTPEKFTAEERYAVTDQGEILKYDLASNTYKPFAAS